MYTMKVDNLKHNFHVSIISFRRTYIITQKSSVASKMSLRKVGDSQSIGFAVKNSS